MTAALERIAQTGASDNLIEIHRFVTFDRAMAYVQMGYVPLPSLVGTHHGTWAVHMMWRCCCRPSVASNHGPRRTTAHLLI
jgi:hypothetical protein